MKLSSLQQSTEPKQAHLSYTSPVEMATERYASEVVESARASIPGGELVLAVLGSANHGENHFEDPDTLELAREPNRHLAFEAPRLRGTSPSGGAACTIAWGRHSPGWKER